MFGRRPYAGVIRKDYKERVMNTVVQIKPEEKPDSWSDESRDFINKLLIRKEDQRLGSKSSKEVKGHPWFQDTNWDDILNIKNKAPFLPPNVKFIKIFNGCFVYFYRLMKYLMKRIFSHSK
jgi:hypothetical protein